MALVRKDEHAVAVERLGAQPRMLDIEQAAADEFERAFSDVERGDVTRADLAAVVAAVVGDETTVRCQWNVVGGQVAVPEAVAAAVKGS